MTQILAVTLIHIVIIPYPFKADAAVTCHYNQSVSELVTQTTFVDQLVKIAVDVTDNHNAPCLRKIKMVHLYLFCVSCV